MKVTFTLVTVLLVIIMVSLMQSEPGFNGTTAGCGGGGCHTSQSGIVSAAVLTGNQVSITVTGASGNVGGELVNSSGTVVAVINTTSSNPFTLTAPSAGSYTVNAGFKNPSRQWGTTSVNIVSAPPAPSLLNSNPISNSQINISWTDNSSNEDGFKIERKTTTGGTYSEIAQVGANVNTYNNTGLAGGTQYCYRVRSYNGVGNSAYSNESCNNTLPDAPSAPLSLVANTIQNPLSVELMWTDNSNNEDGFIIEKETATDAFVVIDSVVANVSMYTDLSVTFLTYNYRVKAYNVTGSSAYSNVAQVSVPVELTSFTANLNSGKVNLIWQTATETNNSGFNIERKNIESSKWNSIGFVNGKGTTTEQQNYSFVDENVSAGKYLYRLKQIDFNGMFEYSNEIEVVVNAPDNFSLNQNYPNPFNPSTTIEFQLPKESFVTLKVYNILGKEVASLVNEQKPAGVHKVNFDASEMPSGMYIYKISTGSFEQTRKMLFLK
ncbi:MAG: T9SS type A sorting domain-containing protein [Ignavibacteriales bacterium]|nr:T9SS type A sorting domain-containing protein [Ignavibacteriales bacterium]